VGANVMPFHDHLMTKARESATTALGAARFAAEFEAGTLLDRDAAVDLALGGTGGPAAPAPAAAPAAAGAGPLAKREAEVARLITDGLTNKQIGARLFLSERTVDSHVRSILNKLGVNSRAQIAAWMSAPDR
jgi:DNA-binding NarL/FixJ family response regulator